MLTPAELELLTAAVDGVLDARQQSRLERLLARSAEARELHDRLKQDAATLRSLPARTCPVELSGSVLEAVARLPRRTNPRRPVVPASPTLPGGVPAWFAFALAVSVLFVIGLASYLYFDASQQNPGEPLPPRGGNNLVQNSSGPNVTPGPAIEHPVPATPGPEQPIAPVPPEEKGPVLVERPKDRTPELLPTQPVPVPPSGPIFTGPSGERIELLTIEPTGPTIHQLAGLEKPRLLGDLSKASAFRLELPCKDAGKSVERAQHVLKGQNLALTVDAIARNRLDRPQWKSSYVLLLEDITAAELTALLDAFVRADRRAEMKKGHESAGPVFPAHLVLSRMNRFDHRDLADHLGSELPALSPSNTSGPLGVDPTRPLAEQTAEQIDRALSGGKSMRPALLLAYGMPKVFVPSPEVKKYLGMRKHPRTETIQVMLVFRHVG